MNFSGNNCNFCVETFHHNKTLILYKLLCCCLLTFLIFQATSSWPHIYLSSFLRLVAVREEGGGPFSIQGILTHILSRTSPP